MVTLSLNIVDGQDAPIPGAVVRLYGGDDTLGADPGAVADSRGAVTWLRPVSGYSGNLWHAWQKFVARTVAGIAWEEFRFEAPGYNPALRATEGEMQAEITYYLPENRVFADTRGSSPAVVWDRSVTGIEGTPWQCWRRYVQGKVVGLSWGDFKSAAATHNPALAASGSFLADQSYLLPRNEGQQEYYRIAYASIEGKAVFDALAPGVYRLEAGADGYLRAMRRIELTGDQTETVTLKTLEYSVPRGGGSFVGVLGGGSFVGVLGRDFVFEDHTFRFMGVNLRGLVHYGLSRPVMGANAEAQLRAARDMGARVVRVFLAHNEVSADETRGRLIRLLKLMDEKFGDMFLIVALANLYSDVEFRIPGDDRFYTHTPIGESRKLLSVDWFREGFTANYLPFVETIVKDDFIRNSSRLMAYNIGNELKAEVRGDNNNFGQPEVLIEFMHTMARRIRQLDGGNHLIGTGMISTRHAHMGGNRDLRLRLYNIPELDFISNHAYHGDDDPATSKEQEYQAASRENDNDLVLQLSQPKPVLVEEAGFEYLENRRDRSEFVQKELKFLFEDQQAAGYMPWGFMDGGDNGDGDNKCGMDRAFHNDDWDNLHKAYRERAANLAALSRLVTVPAPKLGDAQQVFTRFDMNLRREPGLQGVIVTLLPANLRLTIKGASQRVNNLVWLPVAATLADGSNVQGWVAQTASSGEVLLRAA